MDCMKEAFSVVEKVLGNHLEDEQNPLILLDFALHDVRPWQIVSLTLATIATAWFINKVLKCIATTDWKGAFFKNIRKIPFVANKIDQEIGSSMNTLAKDLNEQMGGIKFNRKLPNKGWSKEQVVAEIKKCMNLGKFKVEDGSISGTCHKPEDKKRVETVSEAYSLTAFANPLNPDAFPGIRKFESEVVRMTLDLFNGDENACGTMTSGGSESLILAVKTYRDMAKAKRGVTKPNLVMSRSGHVAFDKAGHLLGVEVRKVEMDESTWTPDLRKFERAIDNNTVMVIASAPQYPHGVMDPVEAIATIARRSGLPLHVDACLGGFLIVFMKELGIELEPFDFSVPGVTSISADTHKFGYAPKGSSVIMYKSKEFIHHQYYISADWSGGIFASPTMAGSRSGGIIAAAWASLMNHGLDGYKEATKKVVSTLDYIVKGIRGTEGLEVLGDPKCCIVAFKSEKFSILSFADAMKEKGWLLSCLQYPTCAHLYVTPMHCQSGVKERFLADLKETAATFVANPPAKLEGRAAVYGMAQSIPDKGLVDELVMLFMDALYNTDNN